MRILIKATNFSLTPTLKNYIESKIGADINDILTSRFVSSSTVKGGRDTIEARVEIGKTTRHHRKGDGFHARVSISLPGKKRLYAEAQEWDMHVAIDKVKDELFAEISKWKEKRRTNIKKGGRMFKRRLKKT